MELQKIKRKPNDYNKTESDSQTDTENKPVVKRGRGEGKEGWRKEEDKREESGCMSLGYDGKHAVRYLWTLKYETIVIKE